MGNCLRRNNRSSRYKEKEEEDNISQQSQKKQEQIQIPNSDKITSEQNKEQIQQIQNQAASKIEKPQSKNQQNTVQTKNNSHIIIQKAIPSWELRKKNQNFNPENLKILNRKNETLFKKPGEGISGKQFMIDNCENCSIYILDNIATLTIDNCRNCQIFIAPCTSSLFLRTTTNSQLHIACGQFRSRDCQNCDILLFCRSQPVIESSVNMKFGCFQYYYPELRSLFDQAKLMVWKNNWSDIYDFTPKPNKQHYSYLPEELNYLLFVPVPLNLVTQDKPQQSQQIQKLSNQQKQEQQETSILDLSSLSLEDDDDNDDNDDQKQKQQSQPIQPQQQFHFFDGQDSVVPLNQGMRNNYDQYSIEVQFLLVILSHHDQQLDFLIPEFNINFMNKQNLILRRSTVTQINQEQAQQINIKSNYQNSFKTNSLILEMFIENNQQQQQQIQSNLVQQQNYSSQKKASPYQIFCGMIQKNLFQQDYKDIYVAHWEKKEDVVAFSTLIFENWNDERH